MARSEPGSPRSWGTALVRRTPDRSVARIYALVAGAPAPSLYAGLSIRQPSAAPRAPFGGLPGVRIVRETEGGVWIKLEGIDRKDLSRQYSTAAIHRVTRAVPF